VLLVKLVLPVESTLCSVAPVFTQVQVTVPFTATVSTAGFRVAFRLLWKKMFPRVTATVAGGGGGGGPTDVAVALNETGDPVAPWTAASAVCAPASGPRVQLAAPMPAASVAPEAGSRLPPVVDQVTVAFA
jgi:hypothetical protein